MDTTADLRAPDAPDAPVDPEPSAASLIGERIRVLRHARGLTLVQVAERSGLSQPFLSQVETGRARPSFASVDRIARALGTTQVELFTALAVSATTDPHRPAPLGPFAEGSVRVLTTDAQSFSPVEFTADNRDFGEYFVHDEEEFVFVLSGTIDVDLDGHVSRHDAGDSFFSRPRAAHRWRTADGAPYRVLVIKQKLSAGGDSPSLDA